MSCAFVIDPDLREGQRTLSTKEVRGLIILVQVSQRRRAQGYLGQLGFLCTVVSNPDTKEGQRTGNSSTKKTKKKSSRKILVVKKNKECRVR